MKFQSLTTVLAALLAVSATGAGLAQDAVRPAGGAQAAKVTAATPAPKLDDSLLLVGGDDGSHVGFQPVEKHPGFAKEILAYNVNTGQWRTNGLVPAPRATLPTVFWKNRFVMPSGELRPGVRSPQVWTFSPTAVIK